MGYGSGIQIGWVVLAGRGKETIAAVPRVPVPAEFMNWTQQVLPTPLMAKMPYRFPALAFTLVPVVPVVVESDAVETAAPAAVEGNATLFTAITSVPVGAVRARKARPSVNSYGR